VTDNTPRCGDGRCDAASETCSSCAADCGCDAATQVCSEEYVSCISNNPLIETMPGRWRLVELNGEPADGCCSDVTTVPTALCGLDPTVTPGDACVHGWDPYDALVLAGTRLFLEISGDIFVDGQVLNEGTRVEYSCTSDACEAMNRHTYAFEKEP